MKIAAASLPDFQNKLTEGSVLAPHPCRTEQHPRDIVASINPVDEATQGHAQIRFGHGRDALRRARPHAFKNARNAVAHGFYVAERKRRRDQGHDFLVGAVRRPMHERNGVVLQMRRGVARREEHSKTLLQASSTHDFQKCV